MSNRTLIIGVAALVVVMVLLVLMTAALTPENTNPAYATAVTFIEAAANGDEATAYPLLSDELQAYVAQNCADGRVSACVQSYTPPEWGGLVHAEFRRADTTGQDVQLVATYEEDTGFTGVCIYVRVEPVDEAGTEYEVVAWSGFIHCGEANASFNALVNDPAVPNRAPLDNAP